MPLGFAGPSTATDEYSYLIGEATEDGWYPILDLFQDASIFQTIAFCRAKMPGSRLDQLVLRRGSDVAAAALVRIIPVPFLGTSMAYVLWGPMFHRRDGARDERALAQALKALRYEYIVKRRLGLRVVPLLTREDGVEWPTVFREAGYQHVVPRVRKRTVVIPMDRSLEQLRRGLDQKWRNCLNSAERNNLTIREGEDTPHFDLFLEVYREMLDRKRLGEPGDIRSFMAAQAALPNRFKLKVFVALDGDQPSAGVICSAIGQRGVFVFGATGSAGMKNKASYLLQWRVIERLRERRCSLYDLHGVNAETNPGVYAFKMGLCGKNGSEVEMLGHFEAWEGVRMRWLMGAAERVNDSFKRLKAAYIRYRGFQG
jgi:lipid II:glycine glycyltransferase (peptidoglycan interpeptide bridge formation enzyme)